jgi:hypothetical protein
MRRDWMKITSAFTFFLGCASLTGAALAKPKSPAELAKSPVTRPAPRKVVRQSQVRGAQGPQTSGAMVYRDPDSGEFREGTHEEARALASHGGAASLAPQPLRRITFSDGSVAVELDDSYMTGVVVERAADGTVRMRCGTSEKTPAPAPAAHPQPETE